MQLIFCILVALLVIGSAGTHCHQLIQNKQFKTLIVQASISALAVAGAVFVIYRLPVPSLAKLMLSMIPW